MKDQSFPITIPYFLELYSSSEDIEKMLNIPKQYRGLLKLCDGDKSISDLEREFSLELNAEYLKAVFKDILCLVSKSSHKGDTQSLNQNALIIAPHSDDALFSLGGFLLKESSKKKFTILNVFSQSDYCVMEEFPKNPERITRLRKREELSFAKILNLQVFFLDLLEKPLRNKQKQDIHSELLIDRIVNKINPLVRNYTEVYFPLAIGENLDHTLVRKAILKIASSTNSIDFWGYEDLPYASNYRETFMEFEPSPRKIPITNEINEKCNLLQIYRSQLAINYISQIRHHAFNGKDEQAHEFFWKLRK